MSDSAEGLRPYEFQVGGHSCILARDGCVWKPLQATELAMYAKVSAGDTAVARALCGLLPEFYGRRRLRLSDVVAASSRAVAAGAPQPPRFSKQAPCDIACLAAKLASSVVGRAEAEGDTLVDFIVIRDLTSGFAHPSVMDVKLGVRQYGDDAPPNKVASHARKCAESTSAEHGARLCGSMVWQSRESRYRFVDKYVWRSGRGRDVLRGGVRDFFDDGARVRTDVALAYVPRLRRLLAVLEDPELFPFRMYSASLLLVYDGGCESDTAAVDMRLIDFAHTYPLEPGCKSDDGIALGVRNILALLEELVAPASSAAADDDGHELPQIEDNPGSATDGCSASPPYC